MALLSRGLLCNGVRRSCVPSTLCLSGTAHAVCSLSFPRHPVLSSHVRRFASTSEFDPTSAPHLAKLQLWLERSGGSGEFMVVSQHRHFNKGRGLFGIQSILPEDGAVVKVPRKLALSQENILAAPLSPALSWADVLARLQMDRPFFSGAALNALFLLHERHKRKDSKWFPWICELPSASTLRTALYFGEAERNALDGCAHVQDLLQEYTDSFATLDARLADLCNEQRSLFPRKTYSTEHFRWALSTVIARAVHDDGSGTPVVIPYIDYVNMVEDFESWGNNVAIYSDEYHYELHPTRQLHQLEEACTIFDGDMDNAQLLLRHGFVPAETNPFARVRFRLRLSESLLPEKMRALMVDFKYADERAALEPEEVGTLEGGKYPKGAVGGTGLNPRGIVNGDELENEDKIQNNEPEDSEPELIPVVRLPNGKVEFVVDFFAEPCPLPAFVLEVMRCLVTAKHLKGGVDPRQSDDPEMPLYPEYELLVYDKMLKMLTARRDAYGTTINDDMAILKQAEEVEDEDARIMTYTSEDGYETQYLDNIDDGMDSGKVIDQAMEGKPLVDPGEGVDNMRGVKDVRTAVAIARLRMQERLILIHHIAELEGERQVHATQHERRMRILNRSKEGKKKVATVSSAATD